MAKSQAEQQEDEILLRMLKTPPKPHAQMKVRKAKTSRAIRIKVEAERAQIKAKRGHP